ncbi:MAG: hypothetical protein A2504_15280 [Bdellovibrionales bacterium RIFOXYD12_FULL_39_22]|nr:MAG: hypothetical protein A2385_02710 [Bdellovibrionales bacterium RIFOXYB1_FULL_39_21]OFZ43158.1 MAG: hypothetical protein A2485_11855 [Bdellovibrionales bacterium RIFOXYC12_FULL_39_17]OFZ47896.1 MAG: hypothetical protein A2404_16495 [Bdellovibrionales bacterium RIFOXYC1_FULL_39_130]OFZ75676.1 MAG: hypothetical protein A2560_12995 [Bdellovibrionales bacterium RIFOXYD1_FULL_39_84]OFZ94166.1 MAG: hypothetical protein A2504_15280 [Bdellovibrionales bacterium RIFOXYD12_FULL_39_22]HLE11768.1 ca
MKKVLRVFALGGNEISPTGAQDPKTKKLINPDLPSQWQRTFKTSKLLAEIIAARPENYYVITHGNGPQVGNILLRSEYSRPILHTIPLDVCGADSQGGIGYMIGQITQNALRALGVNRLVAETLNQVVVRADDPAFSNPTKYIGPAMGKEEAEKRAYEDGWKVKMYKKNEDGVEVYRRVVPSPKPVDIVELDLIDSNLRNGIVPIAVGGGGIPVKEVPVENRRGKKVSVANYNIEYESTSEKSLPVYTGVEAVIDKDLASALLGIKLKAKAQARGEDIDAEFTIFTDVDGAKLDYQKPTQKDLRLLTVAQAEELLRSGAFPDGSMGPKIEAAIMFVKGGGNKAYITRVDLFEQTLKQNSGTTIVP